MKNNAYTQKYYVSSFNIPKTTGALTYIVKLIWLLEDLIMKVSHQHNLIKKYPEIAG